jgi:hypothetical protein
VSDADCLQIQGDLQADQVAANDKPLSNGAVILCMILAPFLFFSFLGLAIFIALRTRGFKRMAREAFNACAIGFFFWLIFIVLLMGAASLFGW